MRWHQFIRLLAIAGLVGGCSVYPLPQDVTGYTTEDIVRNIRCEAQAGIHETVIDWLKSPMYGDKQVWRGLNGFQLAEALEGDVRIWNEIRIEDLHKSIRKDFAFYRNSQIAYEFTLTLEEQNMHNVGAGFAQGFLGQSRRVGALSLSATATRTRSNSRIFNVVDTFEELALKVDYRYCLKPRVVDIVYPMKGKLPIKDLMASYVRINNFANLGGPGDDLEKIFGTTASPAVPQMGDTLTFTTKLQSSVNPSLAVAPPAGLGFLLTSAGLKADDYRSDIHKVIIVASTSPDIAKLDRLDARSAPQLAPEYGGPLSFNQETVRLRPIKNGVLTEGRANYARSTIAAQRTKNLEDDISSLAQSFRQMSQ